MEADTDAGMEVGRRGGTSIRGDSRTRQTSLHDETSDVTAAGGDPAGRAGRRGNIRRLAGGSTDG